MDDVSVKLSLQDDTSSKLSQISSTARTASSQLQQMGRQIDNAFKSKSPEQFASRLGDAAEEASDGFETLGDSVEKAMQDLERGMNIDISGQFDDAADSASDLAEAAEKAGDSVDDLASSAKGLGDSVDGIGDGGDLDGLSEDANSAGESMGNAEEKAFSLSSALKKLFAVVSGAVVLKKVGDFVNESIDIGESYTAMMSEVQAISGASAADMEQLENTARSYGATTVFSATEAAEALKYMSLAGWDAQQSSSALGGVLNLAAASGMGLGDASDMVTDYLSAFGMEASQATYLADMLAYAQSNSNTTAEQLGEAYRNSAANMHAAGQDVETTTSLLEAMANQGYKGSEAGTSLAAIMRDITNQMEDGAIKIGDTAVSVQDASGNFRDLTDILTDVETATYGMGDAQKAAALGSTFTADSIKGVNMILNEGMTQIAGYEDALRSAADTSEEMADTMNDNLTGDLANMNSAWEEMQLQVFEGMEDTLREGVQTLTSDYIPALTEFIPEVAEAATSGIAKIATALSPLITTVLQNPKGVAAAFTSIGTGLAVFKTVGLAKDMLTTVDGTTKLTSALTNLGSMISGNWWVAGVAGLAALTVAAKEAYDIWNETTIEESLESHFGNIELSDAEISDLAGRIIGVDWLANINLALGEFENAEEFHQEAEEALQANEKLKWQAKVQTTLEQGEGDSVSPFIAAIQGVLDGRQDSSGLEFLGNVDTTLLPNGEDNSELVQALVDFANGAVTGAEDTPLEEYAKEVAMKLDPEGGDNTALIASLVAFANEVVSEAPDEDLDPYLDDVLVNLTPEEGDNFMSALAQLTGEITSDKLDPSPTYADTLSVKLTPEMQEDFKSNIETFLYNKQEELSSLTFASVESLEAVLGEKAGSALIAQVQTWAADDSTDMSTLSSSLTSLVEDALTDGVLDVEEQAAIDILQTKINNIVSGWKEAQADAEWQTLEMKWSGKDLTPTSFTSLIEEARSQRESAIEALDADTTEMNAVFNGWLNSGKITQTQRDDIGDLWALNYKNTEGEAIGRELTFAANSIQDAYGDLISENLQRIQDLGGGDVLNRLNSAAESGDWYNVISNQDLNNSRNFLSMNGGQDRKAALQMYETMKPDVTEMQNLIDSYREAGSEIPQALMDSYNQAIEIGAAAGDTDAAWQNYANSIMESGNEQLIDAISNPDNPMYETLRDQMAPELVDAIDRALYAAENTTESADLTELFNAILGLDDTNAEIDLGRLAELCEKYGLDISEYLAEKGIEVDGSDTKISINDFDVAEAAEYSGLKFTGETTELPGGNLALRYEVLTGDTLSGIAEKTGVALDELKAANQQLFDERGTWDLIYEGDLIWMPQVEADTSSIAEQAGEAAEEATAAAQEAADAAAGDVTTTGTMDAEYTAGEVTGADTSAEELANTAAEQAQDNLGTTFEAPLTASGSTDVTLSETNNVSEIYSEVGEAVKAAFANDYSASAAVNVTLTANYSLANPVSTLTFSGGATGSTAISAALHADGGYFDQPHLGVVAEAGGEYIIPIDGSDRSRDMVVDAARMLGMSNQAAGSMQPIDTTPETGQAVGGKSSERTINLNLNGNGSMKISGSGASKEKIVDVMLENLREVFMSIVEQEILEEGVGSYEY